MKIYAIVSAGAAMFIGLNAAEFRNLGFDEAQTNKVIYYNPVSGWASTAELLPGWSLFRGDVLQAQMYFDGVSLDEGYAALIGHANNIVFPIDGLYGMLFGATRGNEVPFSLVQRGSIPEGVSLLQFRYQDYPFLLSINGISVPAIIPLIIVSTPHLAYFDIKQFAGQTVEIRITTVSPNRPPFNDTHYLDTIQLLSAPVLGVTRAGQKLILSWPATTTDYLLQSVDALASSNRWQAVPIAPVVTGPLQSVTTMISGNARFYRLMLGDKSD